MWHMTQGRSGTTLDASDIWPRQIWSYAGRMWHMAQGRSEATLDACGIWPKADIELR
ncbi:hypothetical protein DPMN_130015 [Dreissena polymorpha]|uniref:Uncharacterized protein n=1 Tax=Dreissena polymorpha TaxID=45954 RepID=A0A9D4JX74_DREPO|nr:hypothetical protein DPMN_130015 [Dreissena polymorpha]